jgi:hypothetical protein
MTAALEFAEVRPFAESGGDVAGLLGGLHPDALRPEAIRNVVAGALSAGGGAG